MAILFLALQQNYFLESLRLTSPLPWVFFWGTSLWNYATPKKSVSFVRLTSSCHTTRPLSSCGWSSSHCPDSALSSPITRPFSMSPLFTPVAHPRGCARLLEAARRDLTSRLRKRQWPPVILPSLHFWKWDIPASPPTQPWSPGGEFFPCFLPTSVVSWFDLNYHLKLNSILELRP